MTKRSPKEELTNTYSSGFKRMSQRLQNILIFIVTMTICTGFIIWIMGNKISYSVKEGNIPTIMTHDETKIEAVNQAGVKAFLDSIQFIEDQRRANQNMIGLIEIHREVERLAKEIPGNVGVNYYGVHNGGDVIHADGKWVMEIYATSNLQLEKDFGPKIAPEQQELIYKGFAYLNAEAVRLQVPLIINDLTIEKEIYIGEAKAYLQQECIKSCALMLVKNIGKEYIFVSINFDHINPEQKNSMIKSYMYNLKRFVNNRIF